MKKISKKKLNEIIRSGNFTIIYFDNQAPFLYEGKWGAGGDEEYNKRMDKAEIDFYDVNGKGYVPDIVQLLVDALGGHTDSV